RDHEPALRLRPPPRPSGRARGDADPAPPVRAQDDRAPAPAHRHRGSRMSRVDLDGAVVLVTGAGSGIGASTARRFAQAGSRVAIVDIQGEEAAAIAAEVAGRGGVAHAFVCDVADPPAMDDLAAQVTDELGPVDVLVNNAGVGLAGPFLEASLEDWQWIRSINLDGVVHGCRSFGPAMAQRGRGHIVNVASGAGYVAHRHMAAYCATKSAVIMLSECLRADLAPR